MNSGKEFEQGLAKIGRNRGSRSVMQSFGAVHKQALSDGELSRATKEMIAVAISIADHCDGCIDWHVKGALEAGATAEQIGEVVGVAIMMGGGPATYYGSKALAAVERESQQRA